MVAHTVMLASPSVSCFTTFITYASAGAGELGLLRLAASR